MFFFFKQKTAYEMRISDWSSDVCSSDLLGAWPGPLADCGKAFFVDVDDDDRLGHGLARIGKLVEVEDLQAKNFEGRWVPDSQGHQWDQQAEAEQAAERQPPQQAQQACPVEQAVPL